MLTAEERLKILQMLQDGKIDSESAAQLLAAMGEGAAQIPDAAAYGDAGEFRSGAQPVPHAEHAGHPEARPAAWASQDPVPVEQGRKPRWLRVRVTDTDSGRPRVNVRIPVGLVNLGLKLGAKYSPEIEGIDLAPLLAAAQAGEAGPFVDVYDDDDGEHVEVFLE